MTLDAIFKVAMEQGAAMALAIFSMWMLNRTWESRLEEAKRYAGEIADQRRALLEALNRNTEAITKICEKAEL